MDENDRKFVETFGGNESFLQGRGVKVGIAIRNASRILFPIGRGRSGVPSPRPYPLADMAAPSRNPAKARLRERDRDHGGLVPTEDGIQC
jgi:hypothetical protein